MWSCTDNSVCLSNSEFCPWAQTLIRTRRRSWTLSEHHKWWQSCFQRKAARNSHETSIWFQSWPLVLITDSRTCCSKRHCFPHLSSLVPSHKSVYKWKDFSPLSKKHFIGLTCYLASVKNVRFAACSLISAKKVGNCWDCHRVLAVSKHSLLVLWRQLENRF